MPEKTHPERLKIVHADFVAEKMQHSILKHASMAVSIVHTSYQHHVLNNALNDVKRNCLLTLQAKQTTKLFLASSIPSSFASFQVDTWEPYAHST